MALTPEPAAPGLFPGTSMPDDGWWRALWPDPDAVLRQLGLRPVRRAVDLCCGDGLFTPALARLADRTFGLDLDPALLKLAAAAAQEEDAPGCEFAVADALAPAAALDGPADLILLANTLHGAPDRSALLRAAAATLTGSGCLIVIGWHRWAVQDTVVLGHPRGPDFRQRMTPMEVDALAAAAGLRTERLAELPPYHYGMVLRPEREGTTATIAVELQASAAAGLELWQERLIGFWEEAGLATWFAKDRAFDDRFRSRFLPLHMAAARRDLDGWARTARGMLALLLLLDQFPRNAFRGTAHMLATDALALHFARDALDRGLDTELPPELRLFFYLPFTHSENLADQELSLRLRRPLGPQLERRAAEHVEIIRRFGRFPHRNDLLGRDTSEAEARYLAGGGFAG